VIRENVVDEKEKDEWRKAFTVAINKDNPNKLTEIIRRVNQLIEERKKKLLQKKKASGAE
jgi:Flp pilus assembly protein TadB